MRAERPADVSEDRGRHGVLTMSVVSGMIIGGTLGLMGGLVGVAAAGVVGAAFGAIFGVVVERTVRRDEPLTSSLPKIEHQVSAFMAKLERIAPASVPAIEPPCDACIDVRYASGGAVVRCARHVPHSRGAHLHYEYPESFGVGWSLLRP